MSHTVIILSFQADMSGQTVEVQTQMRKAPNRNCLPFRLHLLDTLMLKPQYLN